ncbi:MULTISPECIES: nuclear transport factor 2 family protein [unclassified Nocardia]|uniref:nuclear transport factor 2 family protein n=1 Tax=unclassified Nocardia TaxID=2637762 RepID=UPI0024A8C687|nr:MULTISPECIES: nuclear transport factor 2 family protein [unclassified Nocardia]
MTTMPARSEFTPSPADVAEVLAWFDRYDAYARARDIEAMADTAMYPLNEVTDGRAESCTREQYVAQLTEQLGDSGEVTMESTRTPHFVNENLVFVITDATITVGDFSQQVRYGDLLVKCRDEWKFQTMVQGGWA